MNISDLRNLAIKYSGRVPRYTSYPTAVEFTNSFSRSDWESSLKEDLDKNKESLSLYLHVPFCKTLCYFCACNKEISRTDDVCGPYLEAVKQELDCYNRLLPSNLKLQQIHWGGGTPNFLSVDDSSRVFALCQKTFPNLSGNPDISIELDPRTCSREQIQNYCSLGFNRVSLGVQDFNPEVQKLVNRIQSFEQTASICEWSRNFGIKSINIDLIYGLPNQTLDGFSKTLEQIAVIRPERIALFGYAHVTWLKKVQRALERAHLPTAEERLELFFSAVSFLTEAGYEHIGLDHFALPDDSLAVSAKAGTLRRNFMGYSAHCGSRVIGIGPSAISSTASAFAQNIREVSAYQSATQSNGLAIERGMNRSREDQLRGSVIESLLCHGKVDFSDFQATWGDEFYSHFPEARQHLVNFAEDGLVLIGKDNIQLTTTGRFFSRSVASIFDDYFAKYSNSVATTFSQAV